MDSMLTKIKRLLALSTSPNVHEAAAAAAKAAELMQRHRITALEAAAMPDAQAAPFSEETREVGVRLPVEARFITPLLRGFFAVRPIFAWSADGRARTIKFLGRQSATEVASYTYEVLTRTFRGLFSKSGLPVQQKRAYYAGLARTVGKRLEAERYRPSLESTALIVRDDKALELYVADRFPRLHNSRSSPIRGAEGYARGLRDGHKVHVSNGITGGANQRQLGGSP